jgi:tetratricopeptide (TPR) repeat protein
MAQSQSPTAPSSSAGVLAGIARLEGPLRAALEEGIAHQRERRFREAEAAYRRALAQQPDQPDALNLLGTLIVAAGGGPEGARLLRRAIAARPDDPTLRANLAAILVTLDRIDEALAEIETARGLAPEAVEVDMNYAHILRRLGRAEEAFALYERIGADHPGNHLARIGAARCQADLGHGAEAASAFREIAIQRPSDPVAPMELAAIGAPEDAGQLPRLLALADAKEMAPATRIGLVHAAARICEDLGRFDEAFAHVQKAKTLIRAGAQADAIATSVNRLIATFDSQLFAAKRGHGDPSARPVFVVGLPRAGANIVARLLAAHPQVAVAGELPRVVLLTAGMAEIMLLSRRYPEAVSELTPEAIRRLAARYLGQLEHTNGTAARIVDAMPTNFEHLGLIALLFPNARILHCRRDPLDVGISCYLHDMPEGGAPLHDLGQIALFIREYQRLMAHWRALLPSPTHDIAYEDLAAEPEAVLRRLVDAIGLPWDDRCLAATVEGSPARAAIARDPVGRWRRFEKHIGPLREALGR